MASTVNFNNHVKQFIDTMHGMIRILYVGAGYDLSSHRALASKPWRRIYTTSLNADLSQFFYREGRQVQAIFNISALQTANTILDHKNPLLIFLNSFEETDDLRKRIELKNSCQALRATISQIMTTAFANLVIVGYDPSVPGELSTEELFKLLMNLDQRCVTFYGLSEAVEQDPYIQLLVNDGIATVFSQDLGDALEGFFANDEQLIEEDTINLPDDLRSTVFISGKPCQLTPNICFEFERHGRVLSIREMDTGIISRMLQVDYFYRFLKRSPYEPQWYGYNPRNGFAVRRDFEDHLYSVVSDRLSDGTENPIILAGQTSSGKSIALAALAYRIFHEHKYPVLYVINPEITFAADTPGFRALDNILIELEQKGAERVLLVIDTSIYNLESNSSIRRLMDRCINRGRKVVVIASAVQCTKEGYEVVEAPIYLSDSERKRFCNLLVEKGKLSRNQVERWIQNNAQDANLLSMLYRFLWDIHPELEHGLNVEISKGIEDTRKQLLDLPLPERMRPPLSAMATQLIKIGMAKDPNELSVDDAKEWQDRIISSVRPFCDSLAVSSLFRLRMPITMATRLLKVPDWCSNRAQYLKIIFDSPWLNCAMDDDEYAQGEYFITFRSPADARIYLASLNTNYSEIMRIVADIILSLKDNQGSFYMNELRFIERLIRMIGPNSDDSNVKSNWFFTYGNGCHQVISALSELRNCGIVEPLLIAQEITYIREFYGNENQDINTRVYYLELAVDIARKILDLSKSSPAGQINWNSGLVDAIAVESVFAELKLEKAYNDILETGNTVVHNPDVHAFTLSSFAERQNKLMGVIESQPENSYAYTALLSCYISYYNDKTISREDKLTHLGSILEIVDNVSANIPGVEANESYQQKKVEFYGIFSRIANNAADTRYFQKLLEIGSPIGIYMKARTMLFNANVQFGSHLDSNRMRVCKQVLDLLEDPQYSAIIKTHAATQYMRLQLKWLCCNAGQPIFAHERQYTQISEADWAALYGICADFKTYIIDRNQESPYVATVYYVLALASAQLGDYETAINTWRLVHENDFYSIGRQKTWHILSTPNGMPILFTGTFNTPYPLPERRIYIKELQRPVLYPSLQSLGISEPKGEVRDLCIGTSYRGFSTFTQSWAKRRT